MARIKTVLSGQLIYGLTARTHNGRRYVTRQMFHQVLGEVYEVIDRKSGAVCSLRRTLGAALERAQELEEGRKDA